MPATVGSQVTSPPVVIHTPDQRVRVFVSSTLQELADERTAVRDAVSSLRLVPVMFELAAQPHPPSHVYRAYLGQSQIFVGVYWQSYGWVAPGQQVSGLEDEYLLSADLPRLVYVKSPAPDREPRLAEMLSRIEQAGSVCYRIFQDSSELQRLVENDLAMLLSERFEVTRLSENAHAGVLPAATTALIDRLQEADEVAGAVLRQGVRLITLTGPGGVGKSRLAIEAAARLGSAFADGVRFVDLGSVSDPELVPAAIAVRLGLKTSGGRLVADLMSFLRAKHLLLLLDNFEQVVGAAPLIAQLLAAAADLVILVTSRTVLRLTGEYELCVPPLAVPPAGRVAQTGELLEYASVRLFVTRARAAAPGFELTSRNAQDVAGICRALDGLPLAIELAAAWIRLLPPRALLARLDDRLSVLTAGARDLPERQRTLRSTLDWSFGLLSPAEQALFVRLGVFAGTFGLPAVAAICGDAVSAEPPEVLTRVTDTLASLVDSSLVRPEPHDDEPRFSLLETVRAYALDRLRESGEWEGVHDRHASYFAGLARPSDSELRGTGQLAWLHRLELRHDNLAAALSWLLERDEPDLALDVVWATWRFWWLRGHAEEVVRYADKILARSDTMPPRQRAHALSAAGFAHFADNDQTTSRRLLKQSLSLYRQVDDKLGMGLAAAALGHLLAAHGQVEIASDLLERTLMELDKLSGDLLADRKRNLYLLDVALADNFLGQIKLSQNNHAQAAELFTDGLSAAENAADRFTILVSLYNLAISRQAAGKPDAAADLLQRGISLAADAGDEPSLANYLQALAVLASDQDRPERATSLLAAASALLEAGGSGWLRAYVPRVRQHDGAQAALHARLGETDFERAWAYGRALTRADAIRYGLEETQPSQDRPLAAARRTAAGREAVVTAIALE
jgi:predicted ATPase